MDRVSKRVRNLDPIEKKDVNMLRDASGYDEHLKREHFKKMVSIRMKEIKESRAASVDQSLIRDHYRQESPNGLAVIDEGMVTQNTRGRNNQMLTYMKTSQR